MKKALLGFFVLAIMAMPLFFNACSVVSQPGVDSASLASVGFQHTGAETSCAGCHEAKRPTTNAGFFNLYAPFDYLTHGAGNDCIVCHDMTKPVRTTFDWANGSYYHVSTLTSCVGCHSTQRPTASAADLVRTGGFNHVTDGAGECFSCHKATMNSAFSSITNWQGGSAKPADVKWDPLNDLTLVTYLPVWSATSLTSFLTSQPATHHMTMDHNTTHVSATLLTQCTTCHSPSAWTGGVFHASLTASNIAQPTSCSDCHSSSGVNAALPLGFVGPVDSTRVPTSPAMHHDAVAWSGSTMGTSPLVQNDCTVCHRAPTAPPTTGNGWDAAVFHSSLTTSGIAQPSSCIDCHANSRPSGKVPVNAVGTSIQMKYDHQYSGMGDCASCHSNTTTWQDGVFHKVGSAAVTSSLTSCSQCHEARRPTTNSVTAANNVVFPFSAYNATTNPMDVATKPFDLDTHGTPLDCASCHTVSGSATNKITRFIDMTDWRGGNFNHTAANTAGTLTSCVSCHSSQRPGYTAGTPPTIANTSITNTISGITTTAFNHATDGLGECIACHQATITNNGYPATGKLGFTDYTTASVTQWGDTDWKGGLTYSATGLMGPNPLDVPTTITATHLNFTNLANFQVGSTSLVPTPLLDQMYHSSAQVPNSYRVGGTSGAALDTAQCIGCHANLPTKYAPGVFHTSAGVVSANLTSCKECHVNTTPKDIVSASLTTRPMDHFAPLSGGAAGATPYSSFDCATCHVKASAGTTFGGATFHANLGGTLTPTNCTACHSVTEPVGAFAFTGKSAYTNGLNHASNFLIGDCTACHNKTTAQIVTLLAATPATTMWNGANYHKNTAAAGVASCVDCHSIKPTTTTTSLNDTQHMNHKSTWVAADCASCHKADITTSGNPALAAGVTPTTANWSRNVLFHSFVTNMTTCKECHGLGTGGNGSTVAGTGNDLPAGLTNSDTTTTSRVAPNGAAAGTKAQIIHTAVDVAGKDCNICHTNRGMTLPAATKWKAALFHKNVTKVTGTCNTCHLNLKPANGVIIDSAGQTVLDHATIGTQDCAACHSPWNGTGVLGNTTNPPNWLGASGAMPATVTYYPPSTSFPTLTGVPHPGMTLTNVSCASCHASYDKGTAAAPIAFIWGNDHNPANNSKVKCVYCHDSGQNVVQTTNAYGGANCGSTAKPKPCFQTRQVGNHQNSSATDDCWSCHDTTGNNRETVTFPTWNSTTKTWNTDGKWK